MRVTNTSRSAFTYVEVFICLTILAIIAAAFVPLFIRVTGGAGIFGPTRTVEVKVGRMYVDYSGSGDSRSSHYMVGTDQGVYEVDNGLFLGVWNADELYAKLKEGGRYRVTTEGNKVVGFWTQSYPYITAVETISP
jgi:hypothetical protein